jgi:hypothetical protein
MTIQMTAVDVTAPATTLALFPVGQVHYDTLGRMYQYCKGGGTVASGDFVKISTDGLFTVALATTTNCPSTEPAEVGCAVGITGLTSTTFAWIFRGYGSFTGTAAGAIAINVKVNIQAAGNVDDAAGTLINGLKCQTVIAGAGAGAFYACQRMTAVAA